MSRDILYITVIIVLIIVIVTIILLQTRSNDSCYTVVETYNGKRMIVDKDGIETNVSELRSEKDLTSNDIVNHTAKNIITKKVKERDYNPNQISSSQNADEDADLPIVVDIKANVKSVFGKNENGVSISGGSFLISERDGDIPIKRNFITKLTGLFPPLPKQFIPQNHWKVPMTPVLNQKACGSCWSFAACGMLSDRIRIKSKGKLLMNGDGGKGYQTSNSMNRGSRMTKAPASNNTGIVDYISPVDAASCNKCDHIEETSGNFLTNYSRSFTPKQNRHKECTSSCNGNYMDSMLDYLCQVGGISISDDNNVSTQSSLFPNGTPRYTCNVYQGLNVYKGISKTRVNLYPGSYLNSLPYGHSDLLVNEKAIQNEIYQNGPVVAIVKIFNSGNLNLYGYKSGLYGYDRNEMRNAMERNGNHDGYHSIIIEGWGTSVVQGKEIPYWLVRNSWGREWGEKGYFRIRRGYNASMIEAEVFSIEADTKIY